MLLTYSQRRQHLVKQLPPNSITIIPGARELLRNGDIPFPFRQHSDFFYLTGFSEPDAIAVLRIHRADQFEYILFVRPNELQQELWDGKRAGTEGACQRFGADTSYPISDFTGKLPEMMQGQEVIYYPFAYYQWFDELLLRELAILRNQHSKHLIFPEEYHNLSPFISEMRLYKTTDEIALMQRAVDTSVHAHIRGMQMCKPDIFEYELAAEYLYVFIKDGGNGPAYPTIVAAGANACTLHYTENRSYLRAGDLVLVDAGAEYQNYSADITRTFPINGRFTSEQHAIYEIVLAAQQAVIDALRPGVPFSISQDISTQVITQGLLDLGLLRGNINSLLEQKAYLPFYMHGCSHWLGLDTHDVGAYKRVTANQETQWRSLMANMVLTVEPGIYIRPETGVEEKWHNIGIRIEDDVLLTAEGCHVLSSAVPKTVSDIESMMQ